MGVPPIAGIEANPIHTLWDHDMKRTLLLLSSLVALFFVASPTMAQVLYVHGGADFPTSSNFNDAYKTGFNAGIGVGINLNRYVEGVVRGSYDNFGNDFSGIDNFQSYSATGNLKLNAPMSRARAMPYALAGAGIFRLGVEDAFESEFGIQFGAGLEFRTSSRLNLTVEPNYIVVFDDVAGENTQYFPIRVGGAFAL